MKEYMKPRLEILVLDKANGDHNSIVHKEDKEISVLQTTIRCYDFRAEETRPALA